MASCDCRQFTPVGPAEIAHGLKVERATVDKWRQRGVFPRPMWVVSGHPVWCWHQIEDWAHDTGRIPS